MGATSNSKSGGNVWSGGGKRGVPEGLWLRCPSCRKMIYRKTVEEHLNVCPECEHHFYVSAYDRIEQVLDEGTFEEWDGDLMRGVGGCGQLT